MNIIRNHDDAELPDWQSVSLRSAPIPLEQLVQEVYADFEPPAQEQMLAQLVGKVFDDAPMPVRAQLLEHLLRSVGVLALIVIANGVFGKICLRGGLPLTTLNPDDIRIVRPVDVTALTVHVLHTSADALSGLSNVLLSAPALDGSAATTTLLRLLLQHAQSRRSGDEKYQNDSDSSIFHEG
ncbi:MAG: hypothetical protein ABIZ09_16975 [Rhodoferax sp.]